MDHTRYGSATCPRQKEAGQQYLRERHSDPEEADAFCRRYSSLWQIESEYNSIKNDPLAKTSSKDYPVRLFYFVFAVLNNIWQLTDFLLKASVNVEIDYTLILTAGECVELVSSALIPGY